MESHLYKPSKDDVVRRLGSDESGVSLKSYPGIYTQETGLKQQQFKPINPQLTQHHQTQVHQPTPILRVIKCLEYVNIKK